MESNIIVKHHLKSVDVIVFILRDSARRELLRSMLLYVKNHLRKQRYVCVTCKIGHFINLPADQPSAEHAKKY